MNQTAALLCYLLRNMLLVTQFTLSYGLLVDYLMVNLAAHLDMIAVPPNLQYIVHSCNIPGVLHVFDSYHRGCSELSP